MSDTMLDRLAARWMRDGPHDAWGLLDYCEPKDAERAARWWLNATADEIDTIPACGAGGYEDVATMLRAAADQQGDEE